MLKSLFNRYLAIYKKFPAFTEMRDTYLTFKYTKMTSYKYYVLDVFTTERYKGNQLAVVFTGTDLELPVYENIAREFGYSETSFMYYSKEHKALKVRSFTPTGFEITGAGHNLLGAVCLALLLDSDIFHEQENKQFVIMNDEAIDLSVSYTNDHLPFVGMRQRPAIIGPPLDPKIIAGALTLNPDEILNEGIAASVVKTEVAHLMVPLKSVEILNKAVPEKALLIELAVKYGFEGVYCFAILNGDAAHFAQARFFNPGIGIDEDAATGSAAGPMAGLLFQKQLIQQNSAYQVLQGVKMNHPSTIKFEVTTEGIWISGSSVIVMEGMIHV